MTKPTPPKKIIAFPSSRTTPPSSYPHFKDLGDSPLSKQSNNRSSLKGHWCKQCEGIWYGTIAEYVCPHCSNGDN